MAASHPQKSIMGRTTDPGENRDPGSAIGALRSGSPLTASKAHKPSIRSLTGKPRLEDRSYTTPGGTTSGTGQASLQSVGEEAAKLACIRSINLPAGLFDGVPSRVLLAYRRRVGAEELHELRRHPDPLRLTLLTAFCHVRGREIADSLTELLITTVHRIGAKAEKRVEGELINDLKRVAGKPALLFKLAAASLAKPDGTVRDVVFAARGRADPARPDGRGREHRPCLPATLADSGPQPLPISLSPHAASGAGRAQLPVQHQAHRPVLDALGVIARHAARKMRCQAAVPGPGVRAAAFRRLQGRVGADPRRVRAIAARPPRSPPRSGRRSEPRPA